MINLAGLWVTASVVFVGLVLVIIWERQAKREVEKNKAKIKKLDLDEFEKRIS